MKNFYEVLRIKPNATQQQIKRAFIELITKYHPDIYQGDKEYAARYTAVLTEAYAVLKDEEKRRIYDETHGIKYRQNKLKIRIDEMRERERAYNPQKETSAYFVNTKKNTNRLRSFFAKMFKSVAFWGVVVSIMVVIALLYI